MKKIIADLKKAGHKDLVNELTGADKYATFKDVIKELNKALKKNADYIFSVKDKGASIQVGVMSSNLLNVVRKVLDQNKGSGLTDADMESGTANIYIQMTSSNDTTGELTTAGININKVLKQYLETMLWATTDMDTDQPLDDDYDTDDISKETVRDSKKDVASFIKKAKGLLDDMEDTDIGHDFWLTRCGHGAGFWDRDLGDVGDKLTKIAESFGEENPYVGDDGKIYI